MNATCSSTSSLSADGAWRFSLEGAGSEFGTLETWLFSEGTMSLPRDEIERERENRGREVQRLMLQAHIQSRGVGEVGPAIEVLRSDGKVIQFGNRREHECSQKTILGEVEVNRLGYNQPGVPSGHPLDKDLALPADSYSYALQRRMFKGVGVFQGDVVKLRQA